MLKKIIKNASANFVLKFLQMVLGVVALPVVVSAVGTDGYGILVLAGTLLGYFLFFDLGLSEAITKYVAQYNAAGAREELDQVISTSLAIFTGVGVSLAIFVLVFLDVGILEFFSIPEALETQAIQVFSIAALMSILAWPRLALQGVMRGLEEFVSLNFFTGLCRVIAVTLAIIAAITNQPLAVIFFVMQCDALLLPLVLPWLIRRRLPGWCPSLRQVRRKSFAMMWAFSGWLMLAKIAVLLEYQVDTLVLGIALPVAAITSYTVLMYPFRIIQQFAGLAASAVMPAVSSAHGAGGDGAIEVFRFKGARIHNAFLAIVTVVMLVILEPFIRVWMGESYLAHLWIAQVAVLFQFFWQSNALLGQVYVGTGRSRRPGIVAIGTGVANLLLSVTLVQVMGLAGVVLGTVVAGALGVLAFIFWCLPEIGIRPRDYVRRIVVPGQGPIWAVGLLIWPLLRWADPSIDSWLSLISVAGLISGVLALVGWRFVLDREDRLGLTGLVRGKKSKVQISQR